MNAAIPNTIPQTANPVAISGTWSGVAEEDRVGEEAEPAEERDDEEHAGGRDPDRADVGAAAPRRGGSAGALVRIVGWQAGSPGGAHWRRA